MTLLLEGERKKGGGRGRDMLMNMVSAVHVRVSFRSVRLRLRLLFWVDARF